MPGQLGHHSLGRPPELKTIGSMVSSGGSKVTRCVQVGRELPGGRRPGIGAPRPARCSQAPVASRSESARPATTGRRSPERPQTQPAEQADQLGVLEDRDRQRARKVALPPAGTTGSPGSGRVPRRLLGGEDAVGDARLAVPDPGLDQALGHHRSGLGLPAVEPLRGRQRAQTRPDRGHRGADVLDRREHGFEGPDVAGIVGLDHHEFGAVRGRVPAAHPPSYPFGSGGGRTGLHLPGLHDRDRGVFGQPQFGARGHHRPVRHPDHHHPGARSVLTCSVLTCSVLICSVLADAGNVWASRAIEACSTVSITGQPTIAGTGINSSPPTLSETTVTVPSAPTSPNRASRGAPAGALIRSWTLSRRRCPWPAARPVQSLRTVLSRNAARGHSPSTMSTPPRCRRRAAIRPAWDS